MTTLPVRMKAVAISAPGGPEVLQVVERAVPRPAPGEVLIRVAAAGVNRPDIGQREGRYPPPVGVSDLPGLEVAGEVVARGDAVAALRVGDAVCALVAGGGYAQYCTAPAAQCLPLPVGWSALEAASLPETFFTVWSNVFDRGRLAPAETLLVHGGASGVGVAALQMAKARGHAVFVTAGSAAKCSACTALGADLAIDYRSDDFVQAVQHATQGRGVDVVLDMVAGDYVARDLACLADDGRVVLISLLGGSAVRIDAGVLLRRRLTITGSALRARSVAFKGAIAASLRSEVWPLMAAGRIRPVIDRVFALDDAAAAHRRLESGEHFGKLMLRMD